MREIGRLAIDGLLEVADHAEVARLRRRLSILHETARCFRWSRDFDKHKKLLRICVLRFVEQDAMIIFANAPRDVRQPHQLARERDLVRVRNRATREAKIPIIALHFCRDA